MRYHPRLALSALLTLGLLALSAPVAQGASFGIEKFFAGNCKTSTCGEGANDPSEATAKLEGFRTAGGDVPYGVTDFVLDTEKAGSLTLPAESVKNLRTDVPPGVVTDPQAVTKCSMGDFEGTLLEPKNHLYSTPSCPSSSLIGVNYVEAVVESTTPGVFEDKQLIGLVYNLEPPERLSEEFGARLSSDFGVALEILPGVLDAHTFIEGNVEWATDYHDYFEIKGITEGLISSRLVFYGGEGEIENSLTEKFKVSNYGFLRNPSACTEKGPQTTTTLTAEAYDHETAVNAYPLPIGTQDCENEPFAPVFSVRPENALPDRPDGVTTEVTLPHPPKAEEVDSANVRYATLMLPEGLTMNPSAAAGLEGCTPEQFAIGTRNEVSCPSHSQIGTVRLEVPTLPGGSLQGSVFLGKPKSEAITGPPYTVYVDAESQRYGVRVRLEGSVKPNAQTGRLEVAFEKELPEQPFDSIAVHFFGGAFAPLANPLTCGSTATTSFTPFSDPPSGAVSGESPFALESCPTGSPPFAPTQSTSTFPAAGGEGTDFTFSLTRPEGQQYIEQVKTVLPAGLAGKIPAVAQCPEEQANAGSCPAASLLGSVTVGAGSGEPFAFTGNVYLTGPYDGAPYGLSFVVPVIAGPFNLGNEVKRAKIEVEPYSSRVLVTTTLPTIRDGIPARIRSLTVKITRPGFMVNPTSCAPEQAESLLRSTFGSEVLVPSSFQAEGCDSLSFKPTFTASTAGRSSKRDGASLVTSITQGTGQANIKSVLVTLPYQLPSRDSTLNKACLAAVFEANPKNCPTGSRVGSATALTPLLPGTMKGTAYYISHGNEKFPDLDVVLEADGVRTILVGNTRITDGVTTTDFADTPDVPVTSFTLDLSTGPYSALGAYGSLCAPKLVMPTVITAQNGKQVKQNTLIRATGCGVQIVGHKVIGDTAYLTVKTFEAGRISGGGSGLASVYRTLGGASGAASLKVPLSGAGLARRPFSVRLRVGFKPRSRKSRSSQAYVTVHFG
jgi:hypothetical protein